jgi:hypothetical protein
MITDYSGNICAEVDLGGLRGEPALGSFHLTVQLKWPLHGRPPERRVEIHLKTAEAHLTFPGRAKAGLGFLATRGTPASFLNLPQGFTAYSDHVLSLSHSQVEAIEARRSADVMVLEIVLCGFTRLGAEIRTFRESVVTPIDQATWVRLLGEMHYRQTLLLEIPLVSSDTSPLLARGGEALGAAEADLRAGDYEGVVAECRKVIDAIRGVLNETNEIEWKPADFPKDPKSATKKQRQHVVRQALWALCSPAVHVDTTTLTFTWTRSDALMVLASVAAEYRRVVSQIEDSKRRTEA